MSVRDLILGRGRLRAVAKPADRSYGLRAEIAQSDPVLAEPAPESLLGVPAAPAEMYVEEAILDSSATEIAQCEPRRREDFGLPEVDESSKSVRLTEIEKIFVVQQLAMYQTPSETVDLVKEEYGKIVSRQAIFKYNPESGRAVRKKWRDIFYATRNKYLAEIANIPLAHQAYRLRVLQDWLDRENRKKDPNIRVILRILVLAAKEVGGMFRKVAGR